MAKVVNGVNIERLGSVLHMLRTEPEMGKFRFRASAEWKSCAQWESRVKDFYGAGKEDDTRTESFTTAIDEPDVLLGTNKGPNPTETLLSALATCIGTTFIYHASAHGVEIDSMTVRLEGDIDIRGFTGVSKETRPGFQAIRYIYDVKSKAPKEKIRELMELATSLSPVSDSVRNQVSVQVLSVSEAQAGKAA